MRTTNVAARLLVAALLVMATGAIVHDIGKLGIPDHILGKPGKLTPEEFQRIQSHVQIGAEILAPVPFPFPAPPEGPRGAGEPGPAAVRAPTAALRR